MNDVILEFKDLSKNYGKTKSNALNDINLTLKRNCLTLILGPSGSGKSTLINIASLMDVPTNGKVIINGKNTSNLSKSERSKIRMNEIGIIYQRENLFPYLNLLENTMLPMISPHKDKALKLLKSMGIKETDNFPEEVSIEEEQKTALARALINDPSVILLDEPAGELENTEMLMELICDIKHKYAVLMVSNNYDLTKYADNLFYIKKGEIKKGK